MFQLNEEQISIRYDSLPDLLKEVGFSNHGVQLIARVCRENHLSDEKRSKISQLVGYVLFGFIHPEDLAKEIREALNLPAELATSIAREIDRKIFAPIRPDLEKVYSPPIAETAGASFPPPVGLEGMIDDKLQSYEAKPRKIEVGSEIAGLAALPRVEAPAPSHIEGSGAAPIAQLPITELPTSEGPKIIHQEFELPQAPAESRRRSLGGLFSFLRKEKTNKSGKPFDATQGKPVAAEVSSGEERKEKREEKKEVKEKSIRVDVFHGRPIDAIQSKPRIVHYTEMRTPLSLIGESAEPRRLDADLRRQEVAERVQLVEKPVVQLNAPVASAPTASPPSSSISQPQEIEKITPIEILKEPIKMTSLPPPPSPLPPTPQPPIPSYEAKLRKIEEGSEVMEPVGPREMEKGLPPREEVPVPPPPPPPVPPEKREEKKDEPMIDLQTFEEIK